MNGRWLSLALVATGLGCSEPMPACGGEVAGACRSLESLLADVPEDVRADDWTAAATAAHARAYAVLGGYYTGDVDVLRGRVSAFDTRGGFSDPVGLATLGQLDEAQNSNRDDVCELALFSAEARMRVIVEQPAGEPGVSYFSTVSSLTANGGNLLSCVDCLANQCEVPDTQPIEIAGLEVTGTAFDDSPYGLELDAELARVDPWTLSHEDLVTVSSLYDAQDRALVEELLTCDEGFEVQASGLLSEPVEPTSGTEYYMCSRNVVFSYTMFVDSGCGEVYGVRDLQLEAPELCCWYFDCSECGVDCVATQ